MLRRPSVRRGPIRFAVTKLVTRRPVYRGFLQDSGRARRWRRRLASLAISPFSSSLPYRRVFLLYSFLTSPASRLYGPMRIPCWSFQTRCGTVIKDKSYLKDVRSNVCNDCNALTRSRYLKPSIIPCYVSTFQITSWFIYEPLQIRNTLPQHLMFFLTSFEQNLQRRKLRVVSKNLEKRKIW